MKKYNVPDFLRVFVGAGYGGRLSVEISREWRGEISASTGKA